MSALPADHLHVGGAAGLEGDPPALATHLRLRHDISPMHIEARTQEQLVALHRADHAVEESLRGGFRGGLAPVANLGVPGALAAVELEEERAQVVDPEVLAGLRGLSVAPSDPPTALELADRLRDREPLAGVIVCDSQYPGSSPLAVALAGDTLVRCMRPLGHLPPHCHIDLASLDRMPIRQWRDWGEL